MKTCLNTNWRMIGIFLPSIIICLTLFTCKKSKNNPPEVSDIVATVRTVQTGQTVTLSVPAVNDPDGDAVTFTWRAGHDRDPGIEQVITGQFEVGMTTAEQAWKQAFHATPKSGCRFEYFFMAATGNNTRFYSWHEISTFTLKFQLHLIYRE